MVLIFYCFPVNVYVLSFSGYATNSCLCDQENFQTLQQDVILESKACTSRCECCKHILFRRLKWRKNARNFIWISVFNLPKELGNACQPSILHFCRVKMIFKRKRDTAGQVYYTYPVDIFII